jgi:hypothetical protein
MRQRIFSSKTIRGNEKATRKRRGTVPAIYRRSILAQASLSLMLLMLMPTGSLTEMRRIG